MNGLAIILASGDPRVLEGHLRYARNAARREDGKREDVPVWSIRSAAMGPGLATVLIEIEEGVVTWLVRTASTCIPVQASPETLRYGIDSPISEAIPEADNVLIV